MGLLRKIRVLVGALVHEPFAPRPEKVELDEGQTARREPSAGLDARPVEAEETERVADLIAQKRREEER